MCGWLLHKHPTWAHATHVLQPWSGPALELAQFLKQPPEWNCFIPPFPLQSMLNYGNCFKKWAFHFPCLKSSWIPMSLRIKATFPMMTCKAIHTLPVTASSSMASLTSPLSMLFLPHAAPATMSPCSFLNSAGSVLPQKLSICHSLCLDPHPSDVHRACSLTSRCFNSSLYLKLEKPWFSQTSYYSFLFSLLTTI